jgi:penicillin-binding protein 2
MYRVINGERGTAREARLPNPGITMAGKTGTSQVRRISRSERQSGVRKNEDKPWEERDHALFVAFAPYRNPRYAIAVVVEHGGSGSKAAAPIARDIMAKALELDPARTPSTFTLERGSAQPRHEA